MAVQIDWRRLRRSKTARKSRAFELMSENKERRRSDWMTQRSITLGWTKPLKRPRPKALSEGSAAIPSKTRTQVQRFVFEDVPQAESIQAVGKIEKMQGYKGYYKARFGDYRVGMRSRGKR